MRQMSPPRHPDPVGRAEDGRPHCLYHSSPRAAGSGTLHVVCSCLCTSLTMTRTEHSWLNDSRTPGPGYSPPSGYQLHLPWMLYVRTSRSSPYNVTCAHSNDSDQGARSRGGATYTNTTGMTGESCVSFCSSQDFNFAGLEYAQECCTCDGASAHRR